MSVASRVTEGVITGLIVAGVAAALVVIYRRARARVYSASSPTVTDTPGGTTTYWGS